MQTAGNECSRRSDRQPDSEGIAIEGKDFDEALSAVSGIVAHSLS